MIICRRSIIVITNLSCEISSLYTQPSDILQSRGLGLPGRTGWLWAWALGVSTWHYIQTQLCHC